VIADIVPLVLGEFRFAVDEPLAGEAGVVVAYAVRHRRGVLLFDTGFGFGDDELDAYYRIRARGVPDVLAEAGIATEDVTSVVNCHLHVDHAGQNSLFPGIPIYVQPAEWEIAHTTEHTILDWIDFPGADYRPIAGDHEPVEGIRIIATPGHTVGHQSLVVATARGDIVLAGQALYSPGEWAGDPVAREGRSDARDRASYDRSVARLKALDPAEVAFGHDRQTWTRGSVDAAAPAILPRPC
jgi:glyoxylase-like metal-dependent hydrolase (beta-lactamase superfamily II)